MEEHYTKIADTYDEYFGKTSKKAIPKIVEMLDLKSDDHLLDLGTGTGMVPTLLREAAGLKYPVMCVEPCKRFVDILNTLVGLDVVQDTAERFCDEMRRNSEQGQKVKLYFYQICVATLKGPTIRKVMVDFFLPCTNFLLFSPPPHHFSIMVDP